MAAHFDRWPIDDVASCQKGERTDACAGPQEGATRWLGQELGSILGQEFASSRNR